MTTSGAASPLGELLKRFAPLLLGGAALTSSAIGLELPPWAVESLKQWGPAAALLLLLVWYVPRTSVQDFISAQQNQAVALMKIGDQLQLLAATTGKLDEIILKIDDIKFGSDIFGERLCRMEERMINAQRQDNLQS